MFWRAPPPEGLAIFTRAYELQKQATSHKKICCLGYKMAQNDHVLYYSWCNFQTGLKPVITSYV